MSSGAEVADPAESQEEMTVYLTLPLALDSLSVSGYSGPISSQNLS
jgi:hypothetical protein